MTRDEFNKQKELIIKQYGQPLRDFDRTGLNESAKRIDALNAINLQVFNEEKKAKKTKALIEKYGKLEDHEVLVPEHLVRQEWLVSFNDKQRDIIYQWLTNTEQTPKQIAEALHTTATAVRAVMSLEAFKILHGHLLLAYKGLMQFPALAAVKRLLQSDNESVVKDIAKLILTDAGVFKQETDEGSNTKSNLVIDPDLMDKLRKQGDNLI